MERGSSPIFLILGSRNAYFGELFGPSDEHRIGEEFKGRILVNILLMLVGLYKLRDSEPRAAAPSALRLIRPWFYIVSVSDAMKRDGLMVRGSQNVA